MPRDCYEDNNNYCYGCSVKIGARNTVNYPNFGGVRYRGGGEGTMFVFEFCKKCLPKGDQCIPADFNIHSAMKDSK